MIAVLLPQHWTRFFSALNKLSDATFNQGCDDKRTVCSFFLSRSTQSSRNWDLAIFDEIYETQL